VKASKERLAEFQRKKDWAGVSKTYYELDAATSPGRRLGKESPIINSWIFWPDSLPFRRREHTKTVPPFHKKKGE